MATLTPRPYQLTGRDFLAGSARALLADEMRVGKSPQAILACDAISAERVLVVAPAIAGEHWRREFAKWSPDRPPAIVMGRDTVVPASGPVTLIASYDRATQTQGTLKEARWDVFIPDECHYAKSITAGRAHMVYGRTGLGWHADRIWSLSGTPAPKHAGELYPMMKAYGIVGLDYYGFINRYCWMKSGTDVIGGTREDRIPELRQLLAKFMLRRMRREVAPDMPEIDFQYLEITPTKAWRDANVPVELPDAELAGWLESRAEHMSEWRISCALAKVPALVEEIDFNLSNRLMPRTVVFGHHMAPLEDLVFRLDNRGYNVGVITGKVPQARRHEIMDAFRAGELDIVVANIQAAGTAVDLSPASHGYFLEMDWVPGNNAQAAARLVSMSKQDPVTMDVCTWPGSVDEAIQGVLMRRASELSKLL